MSNSINLAELPKPICITPVDFQSELDYLLDLYTLGMQEQLNDPSFPYPLVSDPAYQILSTVAYRLGLQRQAINEAAYATMLAYAVGSDLDQIGANYGVERLTIGTQPVVVESDTRFRARIQLALEAWTTAGSRGSYEYHILSASPAIVDVYIDRPLFERIAGAEFTLNTLYDARLTDPIPGDVAITLLIDPNVDSSSIVSLVTAALDAETVIPITDRPRLMLAETIEYAVVAELYTYPGPSSLPIVEAAKAALEAYTTEHYRLGHDIALSGLYGAAHQAGVQRVVLNLTQDIVVQPWQVAHCTSIAVSLRGQDV
ncbi:baseplate J/gp47 family protein [uncultured Thiothrix sp.]|uniref:baseplate assembly protein n=1 Tax=uncultured Thiothrix sp. TaxID=223185 RepID=UPI00261E0F6A|nr:baseplate J/gp47 family protein [uncultured Thiothrix sp.]